MISILLRTRAANSTIEFSLLMVVVILSIIFMQAHFKRGVSGGLRIQIDQMADQFSYEHGNFTTRVIESTSRHDIEVGGISYSNASQGYIRFTEERIEPLDVEAQIGI